MWLLGVCLVVRCGMVAGRCSNGCLLLYVMVMAVMHGG